MIKLIIADDEKFTLNSLAELIDWEKLGFSIIALCSNGVEVLSQMEKEPADVILADIKMPHMSGIELSRKCFESYPDTQILFLSAYRNFEFAKEALKYNVVDYILKPVSPSMLYEAMQKIAENFEKRKLLAENSNSLIFAKQQLLVELTEGLLTDLEQIKKRLSSTDWTINSLEAPCAVFKIHILNLSKYLSELRNCNIGHIYTAISSLLYSLSSSPEFIVIKYHFDMIEILILGENGLDCFEESVNSHLSSLAKTFKSKLDMDIKISEPNFLETVFNITTINYRDDSFTKFNANSLINQAVDFIRENYQHVTLTNTANHVALSPAYFSVYFKKHTGKAFISVVNDVRIQKAQELLRDPDVKPSQVYHMVGYSSQSYFNKLFTTRVQTTPAQYQKKHIR